jgi:hypothetical protein
MYALGVDRFGIGYASALRILEEAEAHPDGIEVPALRIEDYAGTAWEALTPTPATS